MITFNLDRSLIVFGNANISHAKLWDAEVSVICFGDNPSDTLLSKVTEMLIGDALSMEPATIGEVLTDIVFEETPRVWIEKLVAHDGMARYYRVIVTSEAIYAALIDPSDKVEGLTRTTFVPPQALGTDTKAILSTMKKV